MILMIATVECRLIYKKVGGRPTCGPNVAKRILELTFYLTAVLDLTFYLTIILDLAFYLTIVLTNKYRVRQVL